MKKKKKKNNKNDDDQLELRLIIFKQNIFILNVTYPTDQSFLNQS
jgi:hypothetical protein